MSSADVSSNLPAKMNRIKGQEKSFPTSSIGSFHRLRPTVALPQPNGQEYIYKLLKDKANQVSLEFLSSLG